MILYTLDHFKNLAPGDYQVLNGRIIPDSGANPITVTENINNGKRINYINYFIGPVANACEITTSAQELFNLNVIFEDIYRNDN